jgi:hypothetical protein
MSGGAKRRHSSFGFLGKTYIAIAISLATLIPKHKEEATDDIREKGERG